MSEFYPYHAPIILTDAIFSSYGGWISTSNSYQRQAAYQLAEMQMTDHLGTFLLPTHITGTYYYPQYMLKLPLEHAFIISIDDVTVKSPDGLCSCGLQNVDACAYIMSDTFGYILIAEKDICSCAPCGMGWYTPFLVEVAYTSGLPSGVSFQPNMLLALTMAASNNLKEIIDAGALEGGAGDAGIISWSNLSYSEMRTKLGGNNSFGNSAVANKIAKLVSMIPHRRALKLGW